MNEIKFKAWHKKNKRMYYVAEIDFECETVTIAEAEDMKGEIEVDMRDVILLQYIERKDKNGKEIYGDDIVSIRNGGITAIVTWDEYNARYYPKIIKAKHKASDYDIRMYRTSEQWEVIGNKHENPELLKEEIE